jgi:hypothetical protein
MIWSKIKVAEAAGRGWIHLMVAFLPVFLATPAGAQQLQEALAAQVQVDRDAAAQQQELNQIRDRTQDADGRAAAAVVEAENFERFNRLLEEQVRAQEEEIASIDRQSQEIETTAREVQPLMLQMVDTLARFIELDVPFNLEERTNRVRELQSLMPRADVPISEKYRLILEAYQIELDYGRTFDAYEGRLGTGADARTVEFARLGRVSLMYRTPDGSETGYWDANQKTWVVDPSYDEAIEAALRVARGEGDDLLTVPVPAPQEVRS